MNWLDVVLFVVMGVSIFTSVAKGFTREILRLLATALGLMLGIWFYGPAGEMLQPFVSSKGIANLCGFLLVFFSVMLTGTLVAYVMSRLVKVSGLSVFDRMLGGLFGFVRGLIISIGIVIVILAFAPSSKEPGREGAPPNAIVHSAIAPYVIDAARVLTAIAPKELKDEFRRRYEQVKTIWDHTVRKK